MNKSALERLLGEVSAMVNELDGLGSERSRIIRVIGQINWDCLQHRKLNLLEAVQALKDINKIAEEVL